MPSIPQLPGVVVPRNSDQELWLRSHVARLCQMNHDQFPGSQPVSFKNKDLERLENEDFWVCEKSDGVRVLLLVCTNLVSAEQSVYLIDRKNTYRELTGIFFPHHEDPVLPIRNTLIDGELVNDYDPVTKTERMRYLAFDALVVDEQNVMSRTLDKRYGRLKDHFHRPYVKMIQQYPHVVQAHPFDIKIKEMSLSYSAEKVFNVDIPALKHGNDGLIYTCVNAPYTPGTDSNIMKWKAPEENSIDFKLSLRFPPVPDQPSRPDLTQKPLFLLQKWTGDERGVAKYEPFDLLHLEDEEWEKVKESGEQVDERIVEVYWDPSIECWRMMRFRDDKPNGNHSSVVESILDSIADGVDKDALLARSQAIRTAWKTRQAQQSRGPPPSQPSRPPPPQAFPSPRTPARAEFRYGPLASSQWSKVAGPAVVAGMNR